MRLFMYRTVLVGACVVAVAAVPLVGSARECGEDVPCACGDVLTERYQLPGDLGPCEDGGLILRGGAVLDCAGHTIRGRGAPAGNEKMPKTVGVLLDRTSGAVLRGCIVTGFRTGIELREATRSTVMGCSSLRNGDARDRVGYGIHVARSQDSTILECTVRGSADEGIHVGTGANGNALIDNELSDNGRENLYVLNARGTRILRNRASGKVAANLYMKHASDSRVEANRFEGRPVVVRGRCQNNLFVDNVLDGGLTFRSYPDWAADGGDRPTDNVVRGGDIGGGRNCLTFSGASDNEIERTGLTGCGRIVAHSDTPTTNRMLDVAVERIPLDISGGARLRLLGTISVHVVDEDQRAIAGVRIELRGRAGEVLKPEPTDKDGVSVVRVPTHTVTAGGLVDLTPVKIVADADGFLIREIDVREPLPERLTLTLEPAS